MADSSELMGLLSRREAEIVTLALLGTPNTQISIELQISPRTVEAHKQAAYKKLGIHSVNGLLRLFKEPEVLETHPSPESLALTQLEARIRKLELKVAKLTRQLLQSNNVEP
ncbi:DNA-binding CsgD family transcriptional regulator [Devosia sp. UYZn731]|uniref:response regulator transcription factor n=1 Tax=Devosia sp. UYZn731 TaxID=3156345 RepID=UPI00339457DF